MFVRTGSNGPIYSYGTMQFKSTHFYKINYTTYIVAYALTQQNVHRGLAINRDMYVTVEGFV